MSRTITAALAAVSIGAGLLAAAGIAHAPPVPLPCDDVHMVRQVAEVVALPDGWTAVWSCGPAPAGVAGQAHLADRTVTVWPAAHTSVDDLTWTWAHEAAHAWDVATLSDADRAAWAAAWGLDADLWWSAPAWSDRGAERWAETWTACRLGVPPQRLDLDMPDTTTCTQMGVRNATDR